MGMRLATAVSGYLAFGNPIILRAMSRYLRIGRRVFHIFDALFRHGV